MMADIPVNVFDMDALEAHKQLGDVLHVTRDDRGVIVWNTRHVEALFGYPMNGLLGRCIDILVPELLRPVHPGYRARYTANPEIRAMGTGKKVDGKKLNGVIIPVVVGFAPWEKDGVSLVAVTIIALPTE